ncbi:MAG: Serine/threonine-protein kinase PRP4 [Paramarteilia canceri]
MLKIQYQQGVKELGFLRQLSEADPGGRHHVLDLLAHFIYKNHLCIVLPRMEMNLREVLKTYGKDTGLNIYAIKSYSKQLFRALKLIKKCGFIHADIKPDNILVCKNNSTLKLADFGSGVKPHELDYTPYFVSRFYRAPEIIMGYPFDFCVDLWSVGVSLFELFTSKVLFPGSNNNDMLMKIFELKGKAPQRMIRRSHFRSKHFDDAGNFIKREIDSLTNMEKSTVIYDLSSTSQPKKDLLGLLKPYAHHSVISTSKTNADGTKIRSQELEGTRPHIDKKVSEFSDLLDKILVVDPGRRSTISSALEHSFLTN